MAFKSYEELIKMASSNPKQATKYVQSAQNSNRPVVSADNPGYGEENPRAAALKRAMKRNMLTSQDNIVANRKNNNY